MVTYCLVDLNNKVIDVLPQATYSNCVLSFDGGSMKGINSDIKIYSLDAITYQYYGDCHDKNGSMTVLETVQVEFDAGRVTLIL